MAGRVEWSMSDRQLAAFKKRVERYRGRPLRERTGRGAMAAGQYLARPIRAASPVRTGKLKRSVKVKAVRAKAGFGQTAFGANATTVILVGPTAPHRHLVIRGHRIVTRGGRDLGRRTRPNPYVDRAIAAHKAQALRIVSRILFSG